MRPLQLIPAATGFLLLAIVSCRTKTATVDPALVDSLNLKRGEIVSCGPQDGEMFGAVSFTASVPDSLQKDFNVAVALLHSFEYDEAEKKFASVIDRAPQCAMAYWGVAMSNFHPLWAPPSQAELQKGQRALAIARSLTSTTGRETAYIEALEKFYQNADRTDHRTRVLKFRDGMEKVFNNYAGDREAAIFYCLALDAAADPTDKSYHNQRKAFSILDTIFKKEPLHPGVAHYIIHVCDYPGIAQLALPAARKYASIAPASAHAQHMPSHIFTRLGLWDECIQSNLVSVSSAQCYAAKAKIKGHWDEELHGLDYLVYAYLQKGNDQLAGEQVNYLDHVEQVYPVNFKTAYAFAATPARYALERGRWTEAADLNIHPLNFPWEKFPWQEAIIHFARLLGSVHTGKRDEANQELAKIQSLYNVLKTQPDKKLEAANVAVQIKSGEAWISFMQGKRELALQLMSEAADMEDAMEKHPVTPGEVLPARELYAEMLMDAGRPAMALQNFEIDLKTHPNRFNALYGAAVAAQKSHDKTKAATYFRNLMEVADVKNCKRVELHEASAFLSHPG